MTSTGADGKEKREKQNHRARLQQVRLQTYVSSFITVRLNDSGSGTIKSTSVPASISSIKKIKYHWIICTNRLVPIQAEPTLTHRFLKNKFAQQL